MPNLIHSLDATSLSLLINFFFQKKDLENETISQNFYSVHDCFAVTANNIARLTNILKLVYIKLYSENKYILDFDKSIINNIKSIYGEENFNENERTLYFENKKFILPEVEKVLAGTIQSKTINNSKYLIH